MIKAEIVNELIKKEARKEEKQGNKIKSMKEVQGTNLKKM